MYIIIFLTTAGGGHTIYGESMEFNQLRIQTVPGVVRSVTQVVFQLETVTLLGQLSRIVQIHQILISLRMLKT